MRTVTPRHKGKRHDLTSKSSIARLARHSTIEGNVDSRVLDLDNVSCSLFLLLLLGDLSSEELTLHRVRASSADSPRCLDRHKLNKQCQGSWMRRRQLSRLCFIIVIGEEGKGIDIEIIRRRS